MSLFMSESSSLLPPSPLRCRSCFIPQFPLSHPSRFSSSLAPASVSNHLLQPFCFLFRVPFGFPVYHPVTCLSDFFRLPGPVQAVFASTAFTTIVDKTVLGKTTAETLLPPSVCVSDISSSAQSKRAFLALRGTYATHSHWVRAALMGSWTPKAHGVFFWKNSSMPSASLGMPGVRAGALRGRSAGGLISWRWDFSPARFCLLPARELLVDVSGVVASSSLSI
jgi:hypothetical protein